MSSVVTSSSLVRIAETEKRNLGEEQEMGLAGLGQIRGKVGAFRGWSKLDLLAWLKIEQVVLKLTQLMFSILENDESDPGSRERKERDG